MKIAALYANGKVVTGAHHGDAFGKLSEKDKNGEITSGFLDATGHFISDDTKFYVKQVVLIRHGDIALGNDPGITPVGRSQSESTANFLLSKVSDITSFQGFCSPRRRCQETAGILSDVTKIKFAVNIDLQDQKEGENVEKYVDRINGVLKNLPSKSVIISHCNFIMNLAQLASGVDDITACSNWHSITYASVTYVDQNKLKWIGKRDFDEYKTHPGTETCNSRIVET